MKPLRLFMAVDHAGEPKYSRNGFLQLERKAEDARYGWGAGFFRPNVVEVEVRVMAKKKRKPKRPYRA